jgi:hypothetical protein
MGFMLGILLAMMLYNLVLFLFLKDKTYLYYVIYVFSIILYQIVFTGSGKSAAQFNIGGFDCQCFSAGFYTMITLRFLCVHFGDSPQCSAS